MDERQETLDLIRANALNHAYFFDGLEDAGWIDFLAEEGFFTDPPGKESGDGGWVRFPRWPESAYLARVAADAPERVAQIAMAIPATDNVSVMEDLAKIGAALAPELALPLAVRVREWLAESPLVLTVPNSVAKLASHLASVGELDIALELAAELLRIEGEERPGVYVSRIEPIGRVSQWEYARVLEELIPALIGADPNCGLRFLADLLARAVELEADGEEGDFTYIIRPAIANHAQNHDHGLIDVLVSTLRSTTVALAEQGDQQRAAVLTILEAYPRPIFARLRLHLITERGDTEEALAALINKDFEFSVPLWHEYAELLSRRFSELDDRQREAILSVLADTSAEERGEDESEAEASRHASHRLLQRLAMIANHLDDHWRKTYEDLSAEFGGSPEHPAFLSYTSTFSGPISPFDLAELTDLGAEGTVAALSAWEPPGGFDDETPEGLSRVLEEAVKTDPRPYAEIAARFEELEATYVRGLLNGLWGALKNERTFAWPGVFELCAWVLKQPFEVGEKRAHMDRDPGWSWSRKAVADLLTQALAEGEDEPAIEYRDRFFFLLAVLTSDPDPTPEREGRDGGSNMDPATLALNTTRGEAMSALVRYCLWVNRSLSKNERSLAAVPEAREILEAHLDPAQDPSLAVRSVYGRWFASIYNLDLEWLTTNIERVFPPSADEAGLFAAAFDSFLAFVQPWPRAIDLLAPTYMIASERAGDEPRSSTFRGDPIARLGDHLVALRAYGAIDLEPGGIFDVFWSNAPAKVRGEVVRKAGWTIERTENQDPGVFTRLAEMWEWISAREVGEGSVEVLTGFGAWLAAPNLDPAWLLRQAESVLDRGVPIDPDFTAFSALPRLAKTDPRAALAVLRGILDTGSKAWAPFGSREELRELIELCLSDPDPIIKSEASRMVDQLISLGLNDFRDLVDPG